MGGAETYVRRLIAELQNLDTRERFIVFAPRVHDLAVDGERFELVVCDVDARQRKRRILWEQFGLPRVLRKHRLDLVHFPYGTMPCFYTGRSLVTVHDTLRFCFPDQMPRGQKLYRRLIESRIARAGRCVICVSQTDSQIFAGHMAIPDDRVSVVYHGVSSQFHPTDSAGNPKRQRSLLWVGRPYPRKNVEVLIEAYGILKQRGMDLPTLRIVGVEREHEERLHEAVVRISTEGSVSLERPVSHDGLPELFAEAQIFVYPSKYESFGLPVLEAMSAGVPCVCTDIPAFRELYGEAVIYAAPDSPAELADGIQRLLADQSLQTRLAARGRDQAAQYTWRKCAADTLAVYRRMLSD